jgi:hypothetical protein
MSEKNEQCSGSSHVWPDDGDTCKCGAMTHADVQREAKREFTITEKLERMGVDRLVRGLLTPEDVMELLVDRQRAQCEHKTWKQAAEGEPWECDDCGMVAPRVPREPLLTEREHHLLAERASDAMGLAAEMDSLGFPQVPPGDGYMKRRLRSGMIHFDQMRESLVGDLHTMMDGLGARPGPLKERITELVTRTKEMRKSAEEQCTRAQQEREKLASCPGRYTLAELQSVERESHAQRDLWEQLFMFYLPLCHQVVMEEPDEGKRREMRVKAAVSMANAAFTIAWENRP